MATFDTPLNVSPYFDDFDESKNFQRVLFKPQTSVQTRELNQLQAILSRQIERFGDSIYQNGTVIEGCNFIYKSPYPYAKISDNDTSGNTAVLSNYVGQFVTNNSGLKAFVIETVNGYEATAPDLKTIYIRYINSGTNGNTTAFSPGDVLTVTDSNTGIFSVQVTSGGVGFANSNPLVVVPAIVVSTTSGTFSNGGYVTQPSIGSNLQIISIDSTSLQAFNQVILHLAPRSVDLSNASVSAAAWTVANNTPIRDSANTVVGNVVRVLGAGVNGSIITNSTGQVQYVNVTNRGNGYSNVPFITIRSPGNVTGINNLNLSPQNYIAQISVSTTSNAVGNGYAFAITDGIIFQKGMFLPANSQSIIVSKYDQNPDGIAVGFSSVETIITSNIDTSLNDNAVGSDNFNAPGADRMKVTPTLISVPVSSINLDSFLSLVQWSQGLPFMQNQVTLYSNLGDELARRTADEAGNFVTDFFEVTTASPSNTALEGTTLNVVVDPGVAYVDGYRVETDTNTVMPILKGIDTTISNTQVVPMVYGNYIDVFNVAGSFQFSTGDTIILQDTAANALSYHPITMSPVGNTIGTARIRCFEWVSGTAGTVSGRYRLFLFDINMNPGQTFGSIRSIFYNGVISGIADTVLTISATTGNPITRLQGTANNSGLLYPLGVASLKNANNSTYLYRGLFQTAQIANTGTLTVSTASSPNENFPWIGPLSAAQAETIYLVPLSGLTEVNAHAGTLATLNATANVVGTGTTFVTDFIAGDYVYISGNTSENCVRQIISVTNSQYLTVDSNIPFTNTAAQIRRHFQNNVPIPIGSRSGITANVDVTQDNLTINIGINFKGGVANCVLATDIQRTGVSPATKTASRDRFVMICLANNIGNTVGPWNLGIPDAFRLKAVYMGTNSSVNSTSLNVTNDFFLSINQNIDYYDLSAISIDPSSSLNLSNNNWLLVQFDHFTSLSTGFFATSSYVGSNAAQIAATDSLPLSSLGTSINTTEIPQVYSNQGQTFDLLNCLDFRPIAVNTVPSAVTSTAAPINPPYALSFGNTANPTSVLKFPDPTSVMTLTTEQYLGRVDSVFVAKDGTLFTIRGGTGTSPTLAMEPNQPNGTMRLNSLSIPAYPTLPQNPSNTLIGILNTRRIDTIDESARQVNWTVSELFTSELLESNQPRVYTMADIGNIDRRLATVEYYQSLSFLEADISNMVLPSNNDPTQDRFKFGIFADDYDTYNYSANTDPQYTAAIANGHLVPANFSWTVTHSGGGVQTPPYIDYYIVSQSYATGDPPVSSNTGGTPYQSVITFYPSEYSGSFVGSANSFYIEYFYPYQVSSDVMNQTMYFWSFHDGCYINIYQADPNALTTAAVQLYGGYVQVGSGITTPDTVITATTPVVTGDSAVALTQDDINMMLSPTFANYVFQNTYYPQDNFVPSGNGQVKQYGKLTWNHDPSKGSLYLIVIKMPVYNFATGQILTSSGLGQADNMICAIVENHSGALPSTVPASTVPTANGTQAGYTGKLTINLPTAVYQAGGTGANTGISTTIPYSADGRYLIGNVTGLKPSTTHTVYVDGDDYSTWVRPFNGGEGSPVVTDTSGKATIYIMVTSALATDLNSDQSIVIQMKSVDGTSTASTTIVA